jgi:DNA polymerase V
VSPVLKPQTCEEKFFNMLTRMRGVKVPGDEISAIYFHTSDPLVLERPLFLTPLQAGFPAPTDNYIEAMIDLNRDLIKNPLTTFYAHVENDSMEPLIHDGAMVIYDSSLEVRNGMTCVAIIDGDYVIKHYCEHPNGAISLVSENEKYAPIAITQEMDFIMRGRVTGAIHLF